MASFSSDLTRKGNPSHEGKALGNPPVACGSCNEDVSTKHCRECNQPLCYRCVTAHKNLPLLKNHRLINIEDYMPTNRASPNPQCVKHPSKILRAICEECLQSLCDDCAIDHKGHKLQHADFKVSFLQNVSAQKVPGLMQIAQRLEKLKDGSTQKIAMYKNAKRLVKEWRDRLLKIINDDTDQLLHDIDAEISKQEILSCNTRSEVTDCVFKADDFMTILGNARKINDSSVLLSNINECDQMIENAKSLITKLQTMTTTYTTDDLFPHRNQQNNIEKGLHEFFTMTPLTASKINPFTSILPSHIIPNKVSDAECASQISVTTGLANKPGVSTPKSKIASRSRATGNRPVFDRVRRTTDKYIGKRTHYGFCISEHNDYNTNTAIMYDYSGKAVYVFDIDADTMRNYKCDKKIALMCTLSSGKHVIVEYPIYDVHVVDHDFQTLVTIMRRKDWHTYKPCAICHKRDHTFLMTEDKDDSIIKTRLSEVTLESDNTFTVKVLHELDVCNSSGLLSIYPDMEYVIMSTDTPTSTCQSLCKVNLTTGQLTQINLSRQVQNADISSIYTDFDGTTLVGDTSGCVHKVINMWYGGQVSGLKEDKMVTGITTRGDKVIIVSGDKLYVYQ